MDKKPKIVVAPEGCSNYLTAGKEYKVIGFWSQLSKDHGYCFSILSDTGVVAECLEKGCGHLNGGNWIIKEFKQ